MTSGGAPTISAEQLGTPAHSVRVCSNWFNTSEDERPLFDLPLLPCETLFTRMAAGLDNSLTTHWRASALHIPWCYAILVNAEKEAADGKASK
jgi:hypothetical protein